MQVRESFQNEPKSRWFNGKADTVQVVFVAVVWVGLLALCLSLGACADRSKHKTETPRTGDFVVRDQLVFTDSEISGFNRLVFTQGSHLVTSGTRLVINVNEIASEGGAIDTFPEKQKALFGLPGRPGGDVFIKAKTGQGILFIYGRGESGGSGKDGIGGQLGGNGRAGRMAIGTHNSVDVVCECEHIARDLKWKSANGTFMDKVTLTLQTLQHRCIQNTGDGEPGAPGTPGTAGSPGGKGGDSARIYVEIENPGSFQVRPNSLPGLGGTGGRGGPGGGGGLGGPPGHHNFDYFNNCRDASAGTPGAPGTNGADGATGLTGKAQPICVKLGTTSYGNCEAFKTENGGKP